MTALKGVNYAIRSGILAAEAIYEALKAGKATTLGGPLGLRPAHPRLGDLEGPLEGAQHPPRLPEGLPLRRHGPLDGHRLERPRAAKRVRFKTDAKEPIFIGDRGSSYPKPDGQYIFDKLSSVFVSGNQTRDDQPSHIRVQDQGAPRARGGLGEHVPGEGLRDRRRRSRRTAP